MRTVLMACLVLFLLFVGGVAYANLIWLPTSVKPWLERTLAERTHLKVTLDHLAYRLPLGGIAEGVQITDPANRLPPCRLSYVHAQLALRPLLGERRAVFLLFVRLQSPVTTTCQVRGTYDWDTQTLSAYLRLPGMALTELETFYPAPRTLHMTRGTLAAEINIRTAPAQPLRLTGKLRLMNGLADVTEPAMMIQANATFTGAAVYDAAQHRWTTYEGLLSLSDGSAQAAAIPGALSGLHGSARLSPLRLTEIHLEGLWQQRHPVSLNGEAVFGAAPTAHVIVQSRVEVTDELYALLPPAVILFQPQGTATCTLEWNGPWPSRDSTEIARWPCTAAVEVAAGRLRLPGVAEPLTDMTGSLRYAADTLTLQRLTATYAGTPYEMSAQLTPLSNEPRLIARLQQPHMQCRLEATLADDRLSITQCDATYLASRLKLLGDVNHFKAPVVNLYGEGAVQLEDLAQCPALAQPLKDWEVRGVVPLTLFLEGPARKIRAMRGGIKISPTDLQVRGVPIRLRRAMLRWEQGRALLDALEAEVAGGALSLRGEAAVPLAQGPCQAQLTLDRINLAPIVRALWPAHAGDVSGLLVARNELAGPRCDGMALRGAGEFQISEGHLASVPLLDHVFWGVLGSLADRLGYAELHRAEITQASGRWVLADGAVRTNDTVLLAQYANSPIPIRLQGWIGVDQRIDLVVEPQVPMDLLQHAPNIPPAIRELVRAVVSMGDLKRLIGRQRVTGTLQQPVSRFEFSLEELLKQLPFEGFQRWLFPSTTIQP